MKPCIALFLSAQRSTVSSFNSMFWFNSFTVLGRSHQSCFRLQKAAALVK